MTRIWCWLFHRKYWDTSNWRTGELTCYEFHYDSRQYSVMCGQVWK